MSNDRERRSMVEQYLRRSAELLREEAECLRDSHAVWWPDGEVKWDDTDECDRHARESHDEMLALAIQLDLMALAPPADRKAVLEECAKVCEKRAESRWDEHGYVEPDTNAGYYPHDPNWHEAQDEEDANCAAAIRALAQETETGGKE